jgi:indole-3-glycerol phosphate synthase
LEVLVEVHDLPELERALETDARIIGVNNRNLKAFTVDLGTTEALAEEVPHDIILVSESGIKSVADAERLAEAGADALLIGETLMRSPNLLVELPAYMCAKPVA